MEIVINEELELSTSEFIALINNPTSILGQEDSLYDESCILESNPVNLV